MESWRRERAIFDMKTTFEYRGCVIHLVENNSKNGDAVVTDFRWSTSHYGRNVASGSASYKSIAAEEAQSSCDNHLSKPVLYEINLMDDGSVVTKYGEYLGTWKADENDHPNFTPDGASDVLFFDVFVGSLCRKIWKWSESKSTD
jgi:hypothetical protein